MSVKRKLIIYTAVMIIIQAVLIFILSALLIGVFAFLNPEIDGPMFGGVSVSNSVVIKFILIWAGMVTAVMAVSGICISVYINRVLLRPLKNLSEALEHMKNGDLNYEFVGSDDEEIHDICTSFEELRLQLQRSVRVNLKKESEQKMLLANISHDIKTPITSIKGYVEGIRDGIADTAEKRSHYLRTIYAKAESIEQMAENLSIYSKLELGRLQYNRVETDIFAFLADTADKFLLDLQTADMELSVDIPQGEVIVLADLEKMGRVFANIIINSIKYKKPSHGSLTIKAEETENGVLITFADTGIGVAEADIPNIFDGFYRGDPSRNSKTEGNGLGLSISRRIVNDHGGKIWLRSHVGEGTEVIILLPIHRTQNSQNTEQIRRVTDENTDN